MDRSIQVCMYLFTSILFTVITSCSCSPTNSSYEQCKTLLALKEGFDDPYNFNTLSSRINGSDCCRWKGVECDVITREVVTLDISFGFLTGTLNEGLFELKSLVRLDLSWNGFSGGIPKTIGELKSLVHLDLSENGFSGGIPKTIGELKSLVHLDLSFNKFSGGISFGGFRFIIQQIAWQNTFKLGQLFADGSIEADKKQFGRRDSNGDRELASA
eukprot:Gb_11813 [translate_table: standard]